MTISGDDDKPAGHETSHTPFLVFCCFHYVKIVEKEEYLLFGAQLFAKAFGMKSSVRIAVLPYHLIFDKEAAVTL